MLMAQLENGMHEAHSMTIDALESNDEEDKQLAKKKVTQLKKTLKELKEKVIKEANDAEKGNSVQSTKKKAQKISNWVNLIS